MDILPTFLEMAGGKHPNPNPKDPRDRAPYKGDMASQAVYALQ